MTNADVLDRVLAGEKVEASAEVRELAQLASVLQGAWGGAPSRAATSRARAAVLSALQAGGNGRPASQAPLPVVRTSRGRRIVARLALAAALAIGLPVTAWAGSQDALPGQLMYPVKRAFEEVRLAIAGDPLDEASVLLDMVGERVEETVLAASFGLTREAELARSGYEETVARFEGRIVEAQALGLSVEDVLEEATDLFAGYQEVFEAIFGPPPAATEGQPTEVLSAGVPAGADEAGDAGQGSRKGGRGDHKRGGGKDRAGDRADRAGGAGGSSSDQAGSGDSSGGQTAGGGGKGGGGQQDAKVEDPPQADDQGEDDDHDDLGDDSHDGKGKGHVKAMGQGHHKDKGKGHSEGD